MIIKVLMLLLFFTIMVGIGFYCRQTATDVNGFVLGGRSVGPWLTAFAYGTSYFSAVIFVGYAGQFGWKYGIAATWVGIGNALIGSLMAWRILGRRTRIMTQHLDTATMPEFFGKRFGNENLKIAASIITFIFMIPYTASLYNGLSRLFGMAFNIDYSICVVVMAVLTGIYVIVGGYMATAINDFIQGIIMLFGITAVILAVLNTNGGLIAAMDGLAKVTDETVSTTPGVFNSFLGPDPFNLLGVVILTSLGTWGLPQMVQKFYAIKNEKSIETGTVISTFFAIVVAGGCYFLGGFGRLFSDKIDIAANGFDSVIPTMLSGLPDILIGVVVILVLSASMSTLSSLVLTSSSTITLDLIRGHVFKKLEEKKQLLIMRWLIVLFILISVEEKKQLLIMRWLIVLFILISVIIALIQYKSNVTFIAQLMGISWGAMAGAFLAPFLYGLYWRKTTTFACWVNFIFSVGFMFANMLVRSALPKVLQSPINAGAFCMLIGLVIVPVVSVITPKPDEALVADAFSSYSKKVLVQQTEALSDEEE